MKKLLLILMSSYISSTIKYGIIYLLFVINKGYYYSLNLPIKLDITIITIVIISLVVISTILLSIIKSSNIRYRPNYCLDNVVTVLYVILLILLELNIASLVCIAFIIYLIVENIIDSVHYKTISATLYNILLLIMAICSLINNFCIVLYNM